MNKNAFTKGRAVAGKFDLHVGGRHTAYFGPHHTALKDYPNACQIVDAANLSLTAACFNAATELDRWGYDAEKAISRLPELLDELAHHCPADLSFSAKAIMESLKLGQKGGGR